MCETAGLLSFSWRHPKTVVGVGGKQSEKRGRWIRSVADWHMQLVRGDNTQSRVAKFPPELVTDGDDFDCPSGFRSVLDGVDHARSGKEQHQHDQDGNHGPGELYLITP
jgi:hypothetical protein